MNVETKQIVDGTFWYSLDNNGQFQQCTYVALLDTYICFIEVSTFIKFAGSSGNTISKLSAGVHHIIFKFVPTKLSDTHVTKKVCEFKTEPTGMYYVTDCKYLMCHVSQTYIF